MILFMHILLLKEILLLQNQIMQKEIKQFKTFKNNAPFINCISKINDVKIDNAEDLDVVMPMYNLLEYSKNYKKQQVVYGIIIEMNQVILFLLILNLLNIKQVLQEILTILVMVKKDIM